MISYVGSKIKSVTNHLFSSFYCSDVYLYFYDNDCLKKLCECSGRTVFAQKHAELIYLKKYPVSGELAFAIRLRGIRPAKNASRPASTAFFIAEAIKIGF